MKILGSGLLTPTLSLGVLFALFHALIWARTGYYPGTSTGDDLWFSESAYYLINEGALRRPMHDDELGSLTHDFLPPLTNLVQAVFFLIFGVGQFSTNAQSSLWCLLVSALVFVVVRIRGGTEGNAFLASIAIFGSQIVLDVLIHVRFEPIQIFFFLLFVACDFVEKMSRLPARQILVYRFVEGLSLGLSCIAYYPIAPFILVAGLLNYYPDKLRLDRNLLAALAGGGLVGLVFLAYVAQCVSCFFYQVIVTGVSEYLSLKNLWFVLRGMPDNLFGMLSFLELAAVIGLCGYELHNPAKRNFGITLAILILPVFVYARPSQAALPIILCLIDLASGEPKRRHSLFRFAVGIVAIMGAAKVGLIATTAYIQRDGRDYRRVTDQLERMRFGPDDLIAMTGQAWLALRPRTNRDQLHHLIDKDIPDAYISSSKVLFTERLAARLRYAVILDGMVDIVRASYPILDRMFAAGELKLAFVVMTPFQDLPWASLPPYRLLVFEKARP
jgi:hypothetical protein